MKWSHRPSSFVTSLAAVATTQTTHSCSLSGRRRTSCCFTTSPLSGSSSNNGNLYPYFTYTIGSPGTSGTGSNGSGTGSSHDVLYVPLTSYCNTRTLPQLRGPNFRLPPHVVAALCRVRDEEMCSSSSGTHSATSAKRKYAFWCQWLDTQESYQMLPPPLPHSYTSIIRVGEKLPALPVSPPESPSQQSQDLHHITTPATVVHSDQQLLDHRPTVNELLIEVQQWYRTLKVDALSAARRQKTIVIAGEGEPTLRFYDLLYFIQQLRQQRLAVDVCNSNENKDVDVGVEATSVQDTPNIQLRIMTNGLLNSKQAHELLQCCTNHGTTSSTIQLSIIISVLFMTNDPIQYNDIMEPTVSIHTPNVDRKQNNKQPHDIVQNFIRTSANVISSSKQNERLLSMEVTAIDRPDIDKDSLSKLVLSLGITTPIRWRSYFP